MKSKTRTVLMCASFFLLGWLLTGGLIIGPHLIAVRGWTTTFIWYRDYKFTCSPGPLCKGWQWYAPDKWEMEW